jgi:hypothetical protein
MYQSEYLTVRIVDADDAKACQPEETVDQMLWLLDVYDLKEGCTEGAHAFFMRNYHTLYERIPGCMPRWCKTMLSWVVLLQHLTPSFDYDRAWAIAHNVFVADPATMGVQDLMTALDALSMQWFSTREWDPDKLNPYLHALWSCARKWTLFMHATMDRGEPQGDLFKMKPSDIIGCMSRYYWFHQTRDQLTWFERAPQDPEPHFWDDWIARGARHLVVRKFRTELATMVWDNLLLYGDTEIASHTQIGERMSAYATLYKRHPVCLMQAYQQIVSYGDLDALKRFQDIVHMKMIGTYFQNNYQIDFVKYFVCMERDIWKHRTALVGSMVPVIIQQFDQFALLHDGKIIAEGGLSVVFPAWVRVAKKPHGIALASLREQLFEAPKVHTSTQLELPL